MELPEAGCFDLNGMHGVYEVERIESRTFAYAATGNSIHTFSPGFTFSAHKRPWCTLTARYAIASPSPTPPVELSRESSTRKKGRKIFSSSSSGTPGPEFRTEIRTQSPALSVRTSTVA